MSLFTWVCLFGFSTLLDNVLWRRMNGWNREDFYGAVK